MSHDARHRYEWNTIPWRTLEVRVFKLQRRIYQATTRGETKKARRLQKLLASSWSAKSLAVRQVTQENKGKKTAGVDGIKSLTPPQRLQLISAIDLHTPVKPVHRIWIAKPGKTEQRSLGIPMYPAYCISCARVLGIVIAEPVCLRQPPWPRLPH
jgi:RNA-directed DNA polymerase